MRKRGFHGSELIKMRLYWPRGFHGYGINDYFSSKNIGDVVVLVVNGMIHSLILF